MQQIGILTLTGEFNYGNKLQNYALQSVLKRNWRIVETIRVSKMPYIKFVARTYLKYIANKVFGNERYYYAVRQVKFLRFNRKLKQSIKAINPAMTDSKIKEILGKYNVVVYGSDQIWNPEFSSFSDIYLGKFANKDKNVAVSASLGISEIPDLLQERFKSGISRFRAISVREEEAKEAIERLDIGVSPTVIIDPTLMLDKHQWERIENKITAPLEYCLIYILGYSDQDMIEQLVGNKAVVDVGLKEPYGPGEFVYLVHHSSLVITDSYHAAIFSILFGIEAYIIFRKDRYSSMTSRIETLLAKLGISPVYSDNYVHICSEVLSSKEVQDCLYRERKKFMDYISESIDA